MASNGMLPPTPTKEGAVKKLADSSSEEVTRDMAMKDWITFYFERAKTHSDMLKDNLETIEKRSYQQDVPKLDVKTRRTDLLAVGLVQQIHQTIQKNIDLLQDFDDRMCQEFAERNSSFGIEWRKEKRKKQTSEDFARKLVLESDSEESPPPKIAKKVENFTPKNVKESTGKKNGTNQEDGKEIEIPPIKIKESVEQSNDSHEKDGEIAKPADENNTEDEKVVNESESPDKKIKEAVQEKNNAQEEQPQPIVVKDFKVNVKALSPVILKELEKSSFVRVGPLNFSDDEENLESSNKILAEIERIIEGNSKKLPGKAKSTKLKRTTRASKPEEPLPNDNDVLVSSSDSEDNNVPLLSRSRHRNNSINDNTPDQDDETEIQQSEIKIKDISDLMSINGDDEILSDASTIFSEDDEAAARNLILSESEENVSKNDTEVVESAENDEEDKSKAITRKANAKKSKLFMPKVGVLLNSDSDEDKSTKESKKKPAHSKSKSGSEEESAEGNSKEKKEEKEKDKTTPKSELKNEQDDENPKSSKSKDKDIKPKSKLLEKANKREEKKATTKNHNSDSESSQQTELFLRKRAPVKYEGQDESDKSEGDSDVDFAPAKKSKISKNKKVFKSDDESDSAEESKKRKKGKESSDDNSVVSLSGSDSDSENSDSDSSSKKKSKKKRRRIKSDSSCSEKEKGSSDDEVTVLSQSQDSQGKGRKNIRKIIDDKKVKKTTKEAAREEEARKQRLAEKQKMYNQIFKAPESDKLESLVLDFDPETKEPLLSVDPEIVAKLKPHQAKGIQFMWDACFESLNKDKRKSGGAILAHCMGLGKTLQSVALIHTLLNKKETGVKTVLIICPLNTVENWFVELRRWTEDAEGRLNLHKLYDCKGNDRFPALRIWRKNGGVGIIGYETFRNIVNSDKLKGRKKVSTRNLEIVKEALINPGPDLVICDEGHLLKNANSQLSKAVNQVATLRRIVLTGTPLQNNLVEYHTMMSFVKPGLLGDIKEFKNRFVNPILNGQHKDSSAYDVSIMKKRAHVLHRMLEGCVQRLDYSVLIPFLPPKLEYAISVNLSEKQKDLYDHYIKNLAGNTEQPDGKMVTTKLFADYTVLNKVCTHPIVLTYKPANEKDDDSALATDDEGSLKDFIVDGDSTSESDSEIECLDDDAAQKKATEKKPIAIPQRLTRRQRQELKDLGVAVPELSTTTNGEVGLGNTWYSSYFENIEEMRKLEHSGKLQVLMEILKVSESVGDKILIFSQYLSTLDLIEEFLEKLDKETVKAQADAETQPAFPPKLSASEGRYRPGIDYFRIDGSTKSRDRHDQCDKFNKSLGRVKLFLISTRAGGLGINLVGANRVVIFDASWNPSTDLQGIFRVYRFGQTKPCYVYRLLCRGTMEEKIYNRQVVKLSLACRVVDEHQITNHFQYDDIRNMYHFDRNDKTERPTPIVPKDKLLAGLLQSHQDWAFSYLEHDSLLENKEDEELSEDAKKQAWAEYNAEQQPQPRQQQQPPGLLTVQHFLELYNKNSTFFSGSRDWVIRTLARIQAITNITQLSPLGYLVRDVEQQIHDILRLYQDVIASKQRPDGMINREMYRQALQKFRDFFRGQYQPSDLEYRGPVPPEIYVDLFNVNYPNPPPTPSAFQQQLNSLKQYGQMKQQYQTNQATSMAGIANNMRLATGSLGFPFNASMSSMQSPMFPQLTRPNILRNRAPPKVSAQNIQQLLRQQLQQPRPSPNVVVTVPDDDVHILPDLPEA